MEQIENTMTSELKSSVDPENLSSTKPKPKPKAKDEPEAPAENIQFVGADTSVLDTGTKTGSSEVTKDDSRTKIDGKEDDPYAYVKRDEFTSELFKIEILNIHRKMPVGKVKAKLKNLGLKVVKLKMPDLGYAFVTFRNDVDRNEAMKILSTETWKGKALEVRLARPSADPLLKKRKLEAEEGGGEAKKTKQEEDKRPLGERIQDHVTPLWRLTYQEQLERKETDARDFVKELGRMMERSCDSVHMWTHDARKRNKGLICELCPIKPSPVEREYRNKCEFTIGRDEAGENPVVGFRLSKYREGSTVVEACHVQNIPQSHNLAAQHVQKIVRGSDHAVFDMATNAGHWRQLTVRTSRDGGLMMILEVVAKGLSSETVEGMKKTVKDYFEEGEGKDLKITSLYFQPIHESTTTKSYENIEPLFVKEPLQETLLGLKFRISPDAFFQVNAAAAELLYTTVADWADVTPDSCVLDVCCGTGTIGLTLAPRARKVYGIELLSSAIKDAKLNAQINGITNTEWYCGKAEDVLPTLVDTLRGSPLVAVVDPPRAGLHPKVVHALRRAKGLNRLIYVSCWPRGAKVNFLDLCRGESKRLKGRPFKLVRAVPVDLFPLTPHCEMVLLFEREPRNPPADTKAPAGDIGVPSGNTQEPDSNDAVPAGDVTSALTSGSVVTERASTKSDGLSSVPEESGEDKKD